MGMFASIALLATVVVNLDVRHAPKTAVLDEACATLSTEQARWSFSIRNMRAHGDEGRSFRFTGGNGLGSGFCNLASPLGLTVNGISWSKLQLDPGTVRRFSGEKTEGVEFTLCFDGALVNLRASMREGSPTLDWEVRPLTTGSRPVTNVDVRVSAIPSHLRTGEGRFFGYRRQVRTDLRLLPPQKSGKIVLPGDERLFVFEDAEFDGSAEGRGHGPSAVLLPDPTGGHVALNDSWITEVHFVPDPAKPFRFSLFESPGRRLSNAEFEKQVKALAAGRADDFTSR